MPIPSGQVNQSGAAHGADKKGAKYSGPRLKYKTSFILCEGAVLYNIQRGASVCH